MVQRFERMKTPQILFAFLALFISYHGKSQSHYVSMTDSSFAVNDLIRFTNIRFITCNDWEKRIVDEESHAALDSLVLFLQQNPGISLEIGQYTGLRGSVENNQILSDRRAEAVRNLLLQKGADSLRITSTGYGESYPETVYKQGDQYFYQQPDTGDYQKIVLTEAYINQFKKVDKKTYEWLHWMNNRIILKITAIKE